MEKERIAPLNGGFMVIAIVGFFVSFFKVYSWDKSWGVAFMLVFALMLAASIYSVIHTTEEAVLHLKHGKKR